MRGGRKIDEIVYGGLTVIVRLDNAKTFNAVVGSKHLEAYSFDILRERVIAEIDRITRVDWQLVIEVLTTRNRGRDTETFLRYRLKRFWVGATTEGVLLQASYLERDNDTDKLTRSSPFFWRGAFKPPVNDEGIRTAYSDEVRIYVPYKQSTWVTLQILLTRLKEVAGRIDTLLESNEGMNRLSDALTTGLLPAGEPVDRET